jgi:predicted metal-dependent hydrolase
MAQLRLGDISVDVVYKDIKNLYLSVYPPTGRIRISAPRRMDLETIRVYAISKLAWIRKQQTKLRQQERESARDFVNRESPYYLGERYLLRVSETDSPSKVMLDHSTIEMRFRPKTDTEKRRKLLDEWYRLRFKEIIPAMIQKWESKLSVSVKEFGVKKMKTKWGSCNQRAGRIWLNLELVKKPRHCIEYVLVHEMVHLLERKHGERFTSYMDQALPLWPSSKQELNKLPLSHRDWTY